MGVVSKWAWLVSGSSLAFKATATEITHLKAGLKGGYGHAVKHDLRFIH